MVIAVDFDGTIVSHAYPLIGGQIGRSVEILKHLKENLGCRLILWTCREPGYGLEEALGWCHARLLEFDAVNANVAEIGGLAAHKVVADFYIDDRGISRFLLGNSGDMSPQEWEAIGRDIEILCMSGLMEPK